MQENWGQEKVKRARNEDGSPPGPHSKARRLTANDTSDTRQASSPDQQQLNDNVPPFRLMDLPNEIILIVMEQLIRVEPSEVLLYEGIRSSQVSGQDRRYPSKTCTPYHPIHLVCERLSKLYKRIQFLNSVYIMQYGPGYSMRYSRAGLQSQSLQTNGPVKDSKNRDIEVKRFRLIVGEVTNAQGIQHGNNWETLRRVLQSYDRPDGWTKRQLRPDQRSVELRMHEKTLLKCEADAVTPLSDTTRLAVKVGGKVNGSESSARLQWWPKLIRLMHRFPQLTHVDLEWIIPCTERHIARRQVDKAGARSIENGLSDYIRVHAGKKGLIPKVRVVYVRDLRDFS